MFAVLFHFLAFYYIEFLLLYCYMLVSC